MRAVMLCKVQWLRLLGLETARFGSSTPLLFLVQLTYVVANDASSWPNPKR